MRTRDTAVCVFSLLGAVACAPAGPGGAVQPAMTPEQRETEVARDTMIPPGYGTLTQDEVTVSIRSGALLVKVTPLDEPTLRVLAPDTYTRLNALRESRSGDIEAAVMRDAEPFMVSFFSYQPDVAFQPEDVQISYQGRLLRPAAVLSVSGGWGRQTLRQQETQTAVYVFEGPLRYDQPFAVRYGATESNAWSDILNRVSLERTKILSRSRT